MSDDITNIIEDKPVGEKKRRNRKPSIKQTKALQYMNQGNSMRKSMQMAGYKSLANQGKRFFEFKGAQRALESMAGYLEQQGLTNQYMAQKIKQFTEAEKIHSSIKEPDRVVPDYRTQIEGVKLWREILDNNMKSQQGVKKRELTITEFITGEEQK